MRKVAIVVVLLLLPAATFAGRRDAAPAFEVSVGHSVYPQQPRITSITLSAKVTEFSGIAFYGDVGYGLGTENKQHPRTDGIVVGVSGGQRGNRLRYGVQYHVPSKDVQLFARVRILGF